MSTDKMLWAVLWIGCSLLAAVWTFIEMCAGTTMHDSSAAHVSAGYFELMSLMCLLRLIYLLIWYRPPSAAMPAVTMFVIKE